MLLCQFLVEDLLGRLEAVATVRSPSEGGRWLVPACVSERRVLGLVGRFGIGEHLVDFFVDRVLRAVGRHRGVGGHLGPVERDQADGRHPRLGAQAKRRREDGLERVLVANSEPGDRRVIGEESRADHPEGDVDVAGAFDLARAAHPQAVGVHEQGDHRLRVMGCTSPAVLAVVGVEGREVHLVDAVEDEPREVIFWEPVGQRRRQQVELVSIRSDEVLGHDPIMVIAPARMVDLTRALPGTSQIARGSCNRLVKVTANKSRHTISYLHKARHPGIGEPINPLGRATEDL